MRFRQTCFTSGAANSGLLYFGAIDAIVSILFTNSVLVAIPKTFAGFTLQLTNSLDGKELSAGVTTLPHGWPDDVVQVMTLPNVCTRRDPHWLPPDWTGAAPYEHKNRGGRAHKDGSIRIDAFDWGHMWERLV